MTQVRELLFEGDALRRRQGAGRRQGDGVPRAGEVDRLVGRDPLAGASVARRHRAGRRICAISASRSRAQRAGGRPAADGPPVDLGLVVHQARRAAQRADPAAYPLGVALFVGDRRRAARRHVCRRAFSKSAWHAVGEQIGSLLGGGLQDVFRDRPGQARLARLAGRADRRVQPAVRPARSRTADGRVPPAGRDADERGVAGGDQRSVPGEL